MTATVYVEVVREGVSHLVDGEFKDQAVGAVIRVSPEAAEHLLADGFATPVRGPGKKQEPSDG